MSTSLQIAPAGAVQQWKSPSQIKDRILAIQTLMTQVLKKDTDYGIIPGMPKGTKPSLWKPGSEQILAMFQIAVDPVVEDLSNDDCYRFRVTTKLTNVVTGEFLGAGIGEASTDETKYKWRRTYSQAEFNAADPARRRVKYGRYKDNGGSWVDTEELQVRQEPADLANTILKMAKKRSQIDATLTVTGASSMFEQDLEDLPEETRQEMASQRAKAAKPSRAAENVMCSDCGKMNTHAPDCKHSKQCPECHAPAGKPHATGCKAVAKDPSVPQDQQKAAEPIQTPTATPEALELKPGQQKMVLRVLDVNLWKKGNLEKLNLRVEDNEMNEWELGCWDKKLFEILDKAKEQLCVFVISESEKNGRKYSNLDRILAVGSVEY
jgi:hypothetical protein